ncbi:hypothetical protein M124_4284 [Bacteroides fragilis str. 3988T(B)14]|uniref:Uncharacterized protein n=1 Tax=Bacteroides fragilis str. 3988T(B)14 TaxID=1339315 RepID=A0A015W8L0_BACFG|nr:hypothetical protein M124_4284 [Bacteroides fragilis str. 3988T(B)14]EXY81514.1 hypothetical protein M084_0703 [Bacteroides fragilis str. 3988 T1]
MFRNKGKIKVLSPFSSGYENPQKGEGNILPLMILAPTEWITN